MPMSKRRTVSANGVEYRVSDIRGVVTDLGGDYATLPYSLRILAENVLRGETDPEAALKVIVHAPKNSTFRFDRPGLCCRICWARRHWSTLPG